MDSKQYIGDYLDEMVAIAQKIDRKAIEKIALHLEYTKQELGRVFVIGNGGGAAHASHAVCDFRKLCGIDAYCPTDNIAWHTAQENDDGLHNVYVNYLRSHHLSPKDLVMFVSVGGGSSQKNLSVNLVNAAYYAKESGASVAAIVGRDGGDIAAIAHATVLVPNVNPARVTLHTEAFQAAILHLLAGHPDLRETAPIWETVDVA